MKNKITILLPDLNGGGAEKNFLILANYWSQNNINVELLLLKKRGVFLNYLNKNIKVIDLNVNKIRYSFFKLLYYFYYTDSNILLVSLWPLTSITILSKIFSLKKINVILFEHQILSKSYLNNSNKTSLILKLSINLTYYFSHKLICVSNFVKLDIEKMLLYNKKIDVLYNPVYIEKNNIILTNDKIKKMWGINDIKILCVGSLKPEKGHKTLIQAISIIKKNTNLNIKLFIFGEGSLKPDLQELIFSLKLENEIKIKNFKYDLTSWYSSCDLFILPSLHEGFANVIVEALSFQKKIISTKCGGPEEILQYGKFGKLIDINNPKMLANSIVNYNNLNYDKNKLLNRAKEFSKEIISYNLMQILNTND